MSSLCLFILQQPIKPSYKYDETKPRHTSTYQHFKIDFNPNLVIDLNLYDMKNNDYQVDWKATMDEFNLKNDLISSRHTIDF